jgi:hypothetical protein
VAPIRPVTDDYFGTKVVDPYRYMENLKDPEVQAWFKAQDDSARAVLAKIPGRQQLLDPSSSSTKGLPTMSATFRDTRATGTTTRRSCPPKR